MRIGILTYHRTHNYGAVLQAYALLNYLKKNGYEAEIIDYWPVYHKQYLINLNFLTDKKTSLIKKCKIFVTLFLTFPQKLIRYKRFQCFITRNFKVTSKIAYISGATIPNIYDVVIYGSDQIWRYNNFKNFKGFDETYWGEYLNKSIKKIAYAASMGVLKTDITSQMYIKQHLNNFNRISVREYQLKNMLQSLIETDIKHVIDPIFLLSKNEWINLAIKKNTSVPSRYLFVYNLNACSEAENLAKKIARLNNYEIITTYGNIQPLKFSKNYFQSAGPLEFISLISNASFVISSSFHGVAFSILFQKQFYAIGMTDVSRVESLLNVLEISNRLLYKDDEFKFNSHINYSKVNEKLNKFIQDSISFLRNETLGQIK